MNLLYRLISMQSRDDENRYMGNGLGVRASNEIGTRFNGRVISIMSLGTSQNKQARAMSLLHHTLSYMTDKEFEIALAHIVVAVRCLDISTDKHTKDQIVETMLFDAFAFHHRDVPDEQLRGKLLNPMAPPTSWGGPTHGQPAGALADSVDVSPSGARPALLSPALLSPAPDRSVITVWIDGKQWQLHEIRGDGNCLPRAVVTALLTQDQRIANPELDGFRVRYQAALPEERSDLIEAAMMAFKHQVAANPPDYTEGINCLSSYIGVFGNPEHKTMIKMIIQTMVPYELVDRVYHHLHTSPPQNRDDIVNCLNSFHDDRHAAILRSGAFLSPQDTRLLSIKSVSQLWREYKDPSLMMTLCLYGVSFHVLKTSGHYDVLLEASPQDGRKPGG